MIKPGVRFGSSVLAIAVGYSIVQQVFSNHSCPCIITSANDSKHGRGSLHYMDSALDFRTKHIPNRPMKMAIIAEVREALGPDFDVVFEAEGEVNEHLHVEYDPKSKEERDGQTSGKV